MHVFLLLLLVLSSGLIQRGNSDFLMQNKVGFLISELIWNSMWVTEHSAILERGQNLSHGS